jgi:hypothetical protein
VLHPENRPMLAPTQPNANRNSNHGSMTTTPPPSG